MIHEVLPENIRLGMKLEETPLSEFLTADRKAQMLEIFKTRKTGIRTARTRGIKVPLLHDVHFCCSSAGSV